MVSSWNGCWIAPSSSSKSSIHAPKTSYYAPEPRKEKSHLPNTYYCTAYDLAALIPPPASSWHQASPYSLHQQAIPHKRKATDLADSTREKRHPFKLLPFLCWHQEKEASQADFKVVWIEKVWSSSNEEAKTSKSTPLGDLSFGPVEVKVEGESANEPRS